MKFVDAEKISGQKYVAPFAGAWIEIILINPFGIKISSLPSRERGLKFFRSIRNLIRFQSLPSRERGLKFNVDGTEVLRWIVAPFAGAWIEINRRKIRNVLPVVAPFAGAWIEIFCEGIF